MKQIILLVLLSFTFSNKIPFTNKKNIINIKKISGVSGGHPLNVPVKGTKNGNGSTVHVSSSGRVHGGGGRKFNGILGDMKDDGKSTTHTSLSGRQYGGSGGHFNVILEDIKKYKKNIKSSIGRESSSSGRQLNTIFEDKK